MILRGTGGARSTRDVHFTASYSEKLKQFDPRQTSSSNKTTSSNQRLLEHIRPIIHPRNGLDESVKRMDRVPICQHNFFRELSPNQMLNELL